MRNAKRYSLELEYSLFVDKNFGKAFQTRLIEVKREKTNLFMKQNNGIEILDNKDYQFFIDNKNKAITASKKTDSENNPESFTIINEFFQTKIDTFLMVFEKINVLSRTKEITKYECIYKPNPKLLKMTVTVNNKLKMFESVITEFKEPILIKQIDDKKHTIAVEVKYKKFDPNSPFSSDVFNSNKYVVLGKEGKLKLNEKFKDYEFVSSN